MGGAGGFSLRRFVHANVGAIKGATRAGGFGRAPQEAVGRTDDAVLDNSEHAHRGGVVGRHLGVPIGDAGPRAAIPDRLRGDEQGVGIRDRAAANG